MLGVDKDQVWMGSEDSVIYIISMVSMVCNRQLTEHRAEVTGLAVDTDKYRYETVNPHTRAHNSNTRAFLGKLPLAKTSCCFWPIL